MDIITYMGSGVNNGKKFEESDSKVGWSDGIWWFFDIVCSLKIPIIVRSFSFPFLIRYLTS